MSELQTEEQQVEEIKRWWKENGKSVIAGAVLGLGGVGGFNWWQHYQQGQAEDASAHYTAFVAAARSENLDDAASLAAYLGNEFDGSGYAAFAALEMAKQRYRAGDFDQAREQLQWVIDHSKDPGLRDLARLRLGRVLLDQGDLPGARAMAAGAQTEAFAARFQILEGDIAAAEGDVAAARASYEQALALNPQRAGVLQMKLANLGE